jgi:hypothetical protein
MALRKPIYISFFTLVIALAIGCSGGGGISTSESLKDSPLLKDLSTKTMAVMAIGALPAGSFGVDAEEALNIFTNVSGVRGLRQLLGLLAVMNPNGTLGLEYRHAALTFAVVDGARVLTLSFLAKSELSTDTLSTINSTARSHGLDVESIAQNESRVTNAVTKDDSVIISINGEKLSFSHTRTGAWPEPNAQSFRSIGASLSGDGVLGALVAVDLGEFGRILGAAAKLPWTPPSKSTFSAGTFIKADGSQSVKMRLHIPGISDTIAKCQARKATDLLLNTESVQGEIGVYEVVLSPTISCLLGGAPGYTHLRWKVAPPSQFNLLAPFEERTVSRNIPDTWPGPLTPKVEYLKGCEGFVAYTGQTPSCARSTQSGNLIKMRAPFGFIKRLLTGAPPAADELFRLMRLYQDAPVDVSGRINGDDLLIEIG